MEIGDMDRNSTSAGLKLAVALGVLMIILGGVAMAGAGKRHGAMFDHIDANGDDKVSSDEIQPFADKRFTRFDSDGDGVVTAAEIDAHLMKRMTKRRERLLKRFDDDGDGAVTRVEFTKQVTRMFNRIDGDGDGTISRAEAVKMRKHMRGRWMHHNGHGMNDEGAEQSQEN